MISESKIYHFASGHFTSFLRSKYENKTKYHIIEQLLNYPIIATKIYLLRPILKLL